MSMEKDLCTQVVDAILRDAAASPSCYFTREVPREDFKLDDDAP